MKDLIFIHIPKAGGTSIRTFLREFNPVWKPGCLHMRVTDYTVHQRKNSFTFTFSRNPYDRLLSAHAYLVGGFGNPGDIKYAKTLPKDFKDFVKQGVDLNYLHFLPMVSWINAPVDFIGRMENYEADMNTLCDMINVPRWKVPHTNKSKHKHYTEYYDDETRDIVTTLYQKDLNHFKYSFGDE